MIKDVAIIGAGPVGLLAGLLLGQRGISVAIYERWPTFYPLPRACTIDHEAIRLLQDAGLADAFKSLIDPVIGPDRLYRFLDQKGETLLQIDWNRPGASGWAQANGFFQPDLERMLVHKLETLSNVEIHRGHELVTLDQRADGIVLGFAVANEDRAVVAEARYVIGADGARSRVREALGIDQSDLGFSYEWLVVDVVPQEERHWHPYVVQHCDPRRPTTLVNSGPGRRRWEFMKMPDETIDELNTTETAWRLLGPWNITPENAVLERHAVYTFRGSWAHDWQRGRAFLAGDAAHLMPPFLGQGLCSGMRDAMALSWRLAMVLGGTASDVLLETYAPERTQHVQTIIRQAVEMGRIICMLDPVEVAARDERMKAAIRDPLLALSPPPEPRLGDSRAFLTDDPNAGYLSVQGRVRKGSREGLFDDVVGRGWQLLVRAGGNGPLTALAHDETAAILGLVVASFGEDGDTIDLDGVYARWFERLDTDAVLVRPDFYIFGTSSLAGIPDLLAAAGDRLAVGVPV